MNGNARKAGKAEGANGRTQFQYLKQLGAQAGHNIDLTRFDRDKWITASIEANRADYENMGDCIYNSIIEKTRQSAREDAIGCAFKKVKRKEEKAAQKAREDEQER